MANPKVCSIEGCGKPVIARGYCNVHYLRLRRHGNVLITKRRANGLNHCQKKQCPIAKSIYDHMAYVYNTDKYKKRSRDYYSSNAKDINQKVKIRAARDDVRAMSRARERKWRADNPERVRENDRRFKDNNKELVRSYKSKYRARKKHAMPSWLTPDHISQINAVYVEAKRLEGKTGIAHHVDHIVPLAGKIVCGLHVPWNLRAIPGIENLRRPRTYSMDMD